MKSSILQRGQWPSKVIIYPLKSVTTPNCSQVKNPVRTTGTQMSFPETVSVQFVRKFFSCANTQFNQLSSGWSQTIPQVEKPDVEILGWWGFT